MVQSLSLFQFEWWMVPERFSRSLLVCLRIWLGRSSHMWVKPCGPGGPRCRTWLAEHLVYLEMFLRSAFPLCGPIQGVQNCMCEWARSQAGTTAAIHRPHCRFGKSTRIEIRDVGGTFSVSFNGVVQCTTDCIGQVLPARTDRDVYVSDQWYVSPHVILSNLVYTSVTCAA